MQTAFHEGSAGVSASLAHKKGRTISFLFSGRKTLTQGRAYVISIGIDISALLESEQKRTRLKSQLYQAQKMEAIGTLSGGLAHDFNNILGGNLGNAELFLLESSQTAEQRAYAEMIVDCTQKAMGLVRQLLTLSRQSKMHLQLVSVETMIHESVKLLRASIPSTIAIQCKFDESQPLIMADEVQMHQVLMNLCINASHAIRDTSGEIVVRSMRAGPDKVMISVTDTGMGMSPEDQARIFEPFFTTKDAQHGTGLGLAVVLGIVQSHGRNILVQREVGKGTIFSIILDRQEGVLEKVHEGDAALGGTERILLVDDEPISLKTSERVLKSLGYHVSAYSSGVQALEIFCEHPTDYDLLITDQTMPKMTGIEVLAASIHAITSELPIVLCSGYGQDAFSQTTINLAGISHVLSKPIKRQELSHAFRSVLDARR